MAPQAAPFAGVLHQEPQRRQLADLSDGLLVQYALAGDQRAFATLVHRFTGPLFYYTYHVLQDADEAEYLAAGVPETVSLLAHASRRGAAQALVISRRTQPVLGSPMQETRASLLRT